MSIKVPYEDCSRFIENYLHIELFGFQRVILKALCNGENIHTGRSCGRSVVVTGYTEFLSRLLDRHNYDTKSKTMMPCSKKSGYYGKAYIDERPLIVFRNGSWIKVKR